MTDYLSPGRMTWDWAKGDVDIPVDPGELQAMIEHSEALIKQGQARVKLYKAALKAQEPAPEPEPEEKPKRTRRASTSKK